MSDDRSEAQVDEDRERRLENVRGRVSWDPEHDPDPAIRRLFERSRERLQARLSQGTGA